MQNGRCAVHLLEWHGLSHGLLWLDSLNGGLLCCLLYRLNRAELHNRASLLYLFSADSRSRQCVHLVALGQQIVAHLNHCLLNGRKQPHRQHALPETAVLLELEITDAVQGLLDV